MTVHSTKTDNASIPNKIFLRQKATQHLSALRVLDLYAGENVLWQQFCTERYYGIELIKGKGKNLHGDNRRIVEALDLSGFNVIDCDSYGIPFDVMLRLFQNKTLQPGTTIIYTAISSRLSSLNRECLRMFRLSRLCKKCPSLIHAKGLDFFYAMLEKHGVNAVYYYREKTSFDKHYGYFVVQ